MIQCYNDPDWIYSLQNPLNGDLRFTTLVFADWFEENNSHLSSITSIMRLWARKLGSVRNHQFDVQSVNRVDFGDWGILYRLRANAQYYYMDYIFGFSHKLPDWICITILDSELIKSFLFQVELPTTHSMWKYIRIIDKKGGNKFPQLNYRGEV